MRFNYKEIADYKFVFIDGTEIILDTITYEDFNLTNYGTVTFIINDALINKELLEKIYSTKVEKVVRMLIVRDEKTGKDLELNYVIKEPSINYNESNDAEGTKYKNPRYIISYHPTFDDSRTKFEIV
jgi:hypothetical protein